MTRLRLQTTRAPGRGRPRRLIPPAIIILAGGVAGLAMDDDGAAQDAIGVDGARAALERLVETRRVISRERSDWTLGRQLLGERIEVMREEIAELRSRIQETEQSIAETDRTRDELEAENRTLIEASAGLAEMAGELERRTAALLVRMPTPLRERVRPLSQRFPEDPEDTTQSLSVRFQNVIGVLNEITKFNREITVTSERRVVTEGLATQEIEVAAMYVGIAHGFYVSADGRYAGVGSAAGAEAETNGDAGVWAWTARNEAAANIRTAIAILQSEGVAEFVGLPVTID